MIYNTFVKGRCVSEIHKGEPVVIGSKYKGHNTFTDTLNGVHWVASPPLTECTCRIQRALLARHKRLKPLRVDERCILDKDDKLLKLISEVTGQPIDTGVDKWRMVKPDPYMIRPTSRVDFSEEAINNEVERVARKSRMEKIANPDRGT